MKFRVVNIVILILFLSADIYAEAFLAGSVNSVNSDSGFNALRNPALMSGQKKDSAGFFYFYSYAAYTSVEGDIKPLTAEKIESTSDEKFNGTLSISYVKRIQRNSFGFAVRKADGTDQVLISESSFSITAPGISNETKEEKKSFAVSTVFSYSRSLGRNEAVGIQLETGVSSVLQEKNIKKLTPENYNMEITTDKLLGNLNCGYNFESNKYEIGAVIKFGEYYYERQKYFYSDNLTSAKNEKEVSPYLHRNKGLEYTLGLGYNITNRLIFDMEATIGTPFEIKKTEYKDDDNGIMAENNSRSYVKYSAQVNGGLSCRYSRNLNLGIGGAAAIYKADSAGVNGIKFGLSSYNAYSITTGAEIKAAEGVNIILGFSSYYLMSTMKADLAGQSLKLNVNALYMNAIAGVSMSY